MVALVETSLTLSIVFELRSSRSIGTYIRTIVRVDGDKLYSHETNHRKILLNKYRVKKGQRIGGDRIDTCISERILALSNLSIEMRTQVVQPLSFTTVFFVPFTERYAHFRIQQRLFF